MFVEKAFMVGPHAGKVFLTIHFSLLVFCQKKHRAVLAGKWRLDKDGSYSTTLCQLGGF